jgi:hypothetical protein
MVLWIRKGKGSEKLGKKLYVIGIWEIWKWDIRFPFVGRKYIQSSFPRAAYVGLDHGILQVCRLLLGSQEDLGRIV